MVEKVQKDYGIIKVKKSDEVRELILKVVKSIIQFRGCCEEEIIDLLDVFDLATFTSASVISRQGENMNYFYVIDSGLIDVFVDGEHVSSISAKGSFGEESFVGCEATATFRARENCKLWCIHRKDFRNITGHYRQHRLEIKTRFLRNVSKFLCFFHLFFHQKSLIYYSVDLYHD